ncbi:prepilin-type N-terminal cleavage/methylation domain-containing protein [Phycisphaerales bacterium AB-hyl4]|uniref:Prepilin-type N-terminal cleavage/methylation domain-containing protein n=1 Tax=Natronomicrosphaera hydrolytica TaxID=3242702 RepID=A0ABV4U9N1_9BACT
MTTFTPHHHAPPRRTEAKRKSGSPPLRHRAAFTLIELLVVIVIIAAVVAVSFPVLNRLTEIGQGDAGVTTVSSAVNAARVLNHRLNRRDMGDLGYGEYLRYHGTAVIFTQGGELILTETDQIALDTSDNLLQPTYVGFKDVDGTDYISLPRRTGIVGIYRDTHDDLEVGLRFVPPPFAVRFNREGQLTTRQAHIYYDFAGDGYNVGPGSFPAPGYDPDSGDPRRGANLLTIGDGRYIYPYDGMPTVKAVILFDANAFRAAWGWSALNVDMDAEANEEIRQWFRDHGRAVFFSPQTGVALRGESR